jgi:hypothetical protein
LYPIARFITRKENNRITLILGSVFNSQDILKGDHVYQIEECLGELIIKDMGPSFLNSEPNYTHCPTWNWSVDQILSVNDKRIWLTKDESIKLT